MFWDQLFLLVYINDIEDEINAKVKLFADDTVLYQEINNENDVSKLNNDFIKIQEGESK